MFHLIKRVIKWGNRTVTIYVGPADDEIKKPLVKNLGLKVMAMALSIA